MLVARCESLALPAKLAGDPELQREALEWGMKMTAPYLTQHRGRPLAAAILQDLASGLAKHRVGLFAMSDTPMIAFLHNLGVWNGIWPGYAESLTLEVYASGKARRPSATGNVAEGCVLAVIRLGLQMCMGRHCAL